MKKTTCKTNFLIKKKSWCKNLDVLNKIKGKKMSVVLFVTSKIQIHIPAFQLHWKPARRRPQIISNEYISAQCVFLHVLGHNNLSFQEPFLDICCRKTTHYPSRLSFLLSEVSAGNRAAGDSHTQNTSQPTETHTSTDKSNRFQSVCSFSLAKLYYLMWTMRCWCWFILGSNKKQC